METLILVILGLIVLGSLIVIFNHIARLNTWINDLMGNTKYNPDIRKDAIEHEDNNLFEDKDKVIEIVKAYDNIMDDISIKTYDGLNQNAKYLLTNNVNLWVILVHGYTATNKTMFTIADQYYKRGYSILAPNLRGHGTSQGVFTTYGIKEKEDIKTWIGFIKSRYPDSKIILHGESMGAAACMYLAKENPKDVIAIIEDCGYTSYYGMFENVVEKYFFKLTKPMAILAQLMIKPIIGGDVFKSNIESMEKTNIPVLFIHGSKDDLVPPHMCEDLYQAHTGIKDIYFSDGAGHAESKLYNADMYFKKTFEFLERIDKEI